MRYRRETMASVLAGMEPQLVQTCGQFPGYCTNKATWAVWSWHDGETHEPSVRYACDVCKEHVVGWADATLDMGEVACAEPLCNWEAVCYHLSDVARFIRL